MKNNTVYDATSDVRQTTAKQKLLEALKEMPIIQIACKKADVSRATYYRWREEDEDFSRGCEVALQEGTDFINDMSESQKIQLIKEKKMPAITWWDRHNNPKYGAKRVPRRLGLSEEKLNPKDEELMRKALALSSSKSIKRHAKDA